MAGQCSWRCWAKALLLALPFLIWTMPVAQSAECSSDCQAQQSLALARVQTSLLGQGQNISLLAGSQGDGAASTLGTIAGLPAHCVQAGELGLSSPRCFWGGFGHCLLSQRTSSTAALACQCRSGSLCSQGFNVGHRLNLSSLHPQWWPGQSIGSVGASSYCCERCSALGCSSL